MKKRVFTVMCAAMLATAGLTVSAEDLEVQFIQIGAATEEEPISLDDLQMETKYELPGYATVTPISYKERNHFVQYLAGYAGVNEWDGSALADNVLKYTNSYGGEWYNCIQWQKSGTDADFAWLLMDITNMTKEPILLSEEATVTVYYNDEYQFTGWIRQFNYNYDTWRVEGLEDDYDEDTFVRATIDPADEQPIDMMYTGHYVFGCTLPNAVVEGEEPLRMVITLGENELTYHIRK